MPERGCTARRGAEPVAGSAGDLQAENPAGQTIPCDGNWHATRFVVRHVDGKGLLARRTAWVQFCAFDNRGNRASVNGWKAIRVG